MQVQHHVVIIGGGFGGLAAARALAKVPVRVTLIDKRNHHLFQPLLYQVATAGLSAAEIAMPIRKILKKQENVTVLMAEAIRVEPENKKVVLVEGEITYDFLIVASGATHAYFGHDEWAQHAPGLKSIEDAFEIRRRIFSAFEAAERTSDPDERNALLTFAVIGGGPTGVEIAGTIKEIAVRTLAGDFRNFDPRSARIVLIEGLDRILPQFPPELSQSAQKQLADLGVEVQLKKFVTDITSAGVRFDDSFLSARTVIWAAGVRASSVGATLGAPLERNGQVKITPTLNVPGRNDIFVIGDIASLEIDGEKVPGMAPAAMQEGALAARNIEHAIAGQPYETFRYVNKGMMATIGRSAAVAVVGRLRLSGFLAWMAWLLIHLILLVGFRNRLIALINWIWAYFTYQRGGRLILETPQVIELRRLARTESRALPEGEKRPEP
jgi:NADH:ubiquinone reductase (H+-translocating)